MTTDSAERRPYLLAAHAFVCFIDEHAVFLDLASGKYSALGPNEVERLQTCVLGWPSSPGAEATPDFELAAGLRERGLLTTEAAHGKPATPTAPSPPVDCLADTPLERLPRIEIHHVWTFAVALGRTLVLLRLLGIQRALERIQRRRSAPTSLRVWSPHAVQGLVTVFNRIRPWFYASEDRCLLQSIVMAEFLARYGVFPRLIFGVALNPFRAHCWLQVDSTVVNDTPAYVGPLTPIMVV